VSTAAEVRDAISPNVVTEAVVVTVCVTAVVVAYRVVRNYERWAKQNSPWAGPRARTAALKSNYRRRRSDLGDFAQIVSEIVSAVERAKAQT
jgi:hypothetical protein